MCALVVRKRFSAPEHCTLDLPRGAVRIKWKADADFEEEETYMCMCMWSILTESNWNCEAVLGWRYTEAELRKRRERGGPTKKRRRVE